ncbi:unnamed protein product [Fraxinus pennsylvanica]|uniref:Uncharacterized protein n=1 Tax=Fraxinus pennsylvanica TaxID=56036 RepID=A0AAD1Z4B8_9LAMI|nr:unnamed protein product [Fraxinus pennsylvanica]
MGVSVRDNDLLKLVHPGRYVEIYREPVIAADIMTKYPRHCIARPDVFQFPWISVRPESVLVPGKVFYLVPFSTMHKLLESKKPQHDQNSSGRNQSDHDHSHRHPLHRRHNPRRHHDYDQTSPIKSMAGVTPKHLPHDRYNFRQFDNKNSHDHQDQDFDGSLYRSSFYESWNSAREILNHDKTDYQIDSLFDSVMTRNGRLRVTTPERDALQLRSCMRKPDSVRKLLELKVTFASPIIIPSTPRESPRLQHHFMTS